MPKMYEELRAKPAIARVWAAGALLACAAIASTPARADVVAPAGLAPGDTFQLVFVTSTTTTATSTTISYYDDFVNDVADSAGLGTYNGASVSWLVLGSTASSSANSTEPTTDTAPIYTLNGVEVAANASALWSGSLSAPIDINQDGSVDNEDVWTGTNAGGGVAYGIFPLGPSTFNTCCSGIGIDRFTNSNWTLSGEDEATGTFALYAISPVLTVPDLPAPEPATAAVLGVGLAGLAVARRRRTVRNPGPRAVTPSGGVCVSTVRIDFEVDTMNDKIGGPIAKEWLIGGMI